MGVPTFGTKNIAAQFFLNNCTIQADFNNVNKRFPFKESKTFSKSILISRFSY